MHCFRESLGENCSNLPFPNNEPAGVRCILSSGFPEIGIKVSIHSDALLLQLVKC